MTASKPKTASPTVDAMVPGPGPMIAVGSVAMQAWMELGNEAIRFVWDRLQQDIKTQQAVLACTSLEEVQRVQSEFFRSAQDQYTAEARKMLEIIGKSTTAGMVATSQARKYDDVPL
ncbi:MAG: phasin family protein [Tabrizicola sp.]|nr:phasin family protein [Tabrizicola sp.]